MTRSFVDEVITSFTLPYQEINFYYCQMCNYRRKITKQFNFDVIND